MSDQTYTYPCSRCGREITTSSEMLGKVEPCPYCETRNVVGSPEPKEADPADLYRTAKGALICAGLSFLWVPLLFLSPYLPILPILLGLAAVALAYTAGRNVPPDSDLAGPVRKLTTIGIRMALVSLALLLAVAIVLWTTGYQPWPEPPEPIEGPEGPPDHSRTFDDSDTRNHTQKWTISRNSSMRRSTSSRVEAVSLLSEKSSSSIPATTVP